MPRKVLPFILVFLTAWFLPGCKQKSLITAPPQGQDTATLALASFNL